MDWHTLTLSTPRLSLRPFSPGDAAEAFACITPTLTRYMSFDPPASPAAFEAVWRTWLATIAAGDDFTFVVRRAAGGAFIGLCGLHRTSDPQPELGIWIREDAHAQGYGREAVGAVARWAGEIFPCSGFVYPVAEANLPSRRLAESLGGMPVGRRPGAKYDAVVYRIPVDPAR